MLPLTGIKVVELGANLAGPYAAEVLGHLGADVVKIERPEGDDARHWGPPFHHGVAPSYLAVNANKRGITVDLKDRQAVAWLADFIGEADVLIQNHRPGTLDALGLGPEALTKRYPRLVYCSVWAFGRQGPLALKPAYEPVVQAFAGLMQMNAAEGDPPTRIGVSALDYGTGMWTAIGALAGLFQRAQTGRGCVVDSSLLETGLAWLKGPIALLKTTGAVPDRHRTGSGRLIPFQAFETKTGPILIAAGNDRLFAKLAGVLARPEWATEARFTSNAARQANKTELLGQMQEILLTRSKGECRARRSTACPRCWPSRRPTPSPARRCRWSGSRCRSTACGRRSVGPRPRSGNTTTRSFPRRIGERSDVDTSRRLKATGRPR